MADYVSKFTGAQIDEGITSANKVPALENSVNALNTNKADKSSIPTKLPNPQTLTINGEVYDGSTEVEITVLESLPLSGQTQVGGLFTYYDEATNRLFQGLRPITSEDLA